MAELEQQFLTRLRETFKVEADEHLSAISGTLLELEKSPVSDRAASLVEAVYREAHSLKGAARAVNYSDIEALCQSLEEVLASWKKGELAPSAHLFDALHRSVDAAARLLASPSDSGLAAKDLTRLAGELAALKLSSSKLSSPAGPAKPTARAATAFHPLKTMDQPAPGASGATAASISAKAPAAPSPQPPAPTAPAAPAAEAAPVETLRISAAKLDRLFVEVEEMLGIKLSVARRASDLAELRSSFEQWRKRWARSAPDVRLVRRFLEGAARQGRDVSRWKRAMALLDVLDAQSNEIKEIEERLRGLEHSADQDRRSSKHLVDSLLDSMKKALMVPFSTFFQIIPKLVRDQAHDQGKEIELTVEGGDVEIDRRILEQLKDPIIHLLRNAIDHGVEAPKERLGRGKPPRGSVTIQVFQSQGKVELLISDDGAGIDAARVRTAAVAMGLRSEAESAVDDAAAVQLIFQSGLSTSPILTDISGRGLGMAIVREKVQKIGGRVMVETRPGQGTTFRLILPLTLATFRGILVQASGRPFIIPTARVDHVLRVRPGEVRTVAGRMTILVGDEPVAFVRLSDLLNLPKPADVPPASEGISVVVVVSGDQRAAFGVDEVSNEQEVLVKTMGARLRRVRHIAAATVLGSGQVVPILEAADLVASAAAALAPAAPVAAAPPRQKWVLIAEDSITSRMLLKNILESAGYQAQTAVDGLAAMTALRSKPFDLVVSDVEMPRMDGFQLTASIRGDKNLQNMPVVLVTSREAPADRERGIDAGANAYLVKSSFDQSNLLDVVRKLA